MKMTKEMIHIACAIDDNFMIPAAAMLVSLFENNKGNEIYLHLFSASLKDENVDHLSGIARKYNSQFTFYPLDKSSFENFYINDRISLAAYYRILIPELIKDKTNRVIYFDGDLIINGNIASLWNTNLEDCIIGATDDIAGLDFREYERLKIPSRYRYFNSGVLLIDVKKWNETATTQRVLNYIRDKGSVIKFHDQDGLNGVLFDKRKNLSPIWNQQVGLHYCGPGFVRSVFPDINLRKIRKHAIIIHFNGGEKPWQYVSLHPFSKKFRHYLKISGLKTNPEKITIKKIIKKQAYRIIGWRRLSRYIYNKNKSIQYAS